MKLTFSFANTFRRPDWSLASVILFASGARPSAVYSSGNIRAEIPDPAGHGFATAERMAQFLTALSDRSTPPKSLEQVGDFDELTWLEIFQKDLRLGHYTPVRFRSLYAAIFELYLRKLPAALVAAFRTEYFLSNEKLNAEALPVRIVQAAYDVDEDKAISALEKLRDSVIRSIVQNDSKLEVSPAHFGLVPHEYNVPASPGDPMRVRVKVLPNPHAGGSGPTQAIPRRRAGQALITPAPYSEQFEEYDETRYAMVDDLPPEILGLDTIVQLRGLGLLTLKDVAERVSGNQLMYELGLTRDQIRDLYYYVRDNYGLKMNIGEEFGITLHIFRPEFRRKHPMPKK